MGFGTSTSPRPPVPVASFISCPARPSSSCYIPPSYARGWASSRFMVSPALFRFLPCSCWPTSLRREKRDFFLTLLGITHWVFGHLLGVCHLACVFRSLPRRLCPVQVKGMSSPFNPSVCPRDFREGQHYSRNLSRDGLGASPTESSSYVSGSFRF